MRQHNAFPRTKTLALGATLLGLGLAALLFVTIWGVVDVRRIRKASHLTEGYQVMREFLALQRTATTSATLFDVSIDHTSCPITPIRLSTALRWTGLEANEFALVPAELAAQSKRPSEQLLLSLYNARTDELRTSITVTEWFFET